MHKLKERKFVSILLPPSFGIPAVGWYCLLVALGFLGIGLHRRINLLLLLGDVIFVITLLNLLAAGRSLRGLKARRRLDEWLFARTPCSVEVQVSNHSQSARLGLSIKDEGPSHAAAWQIDCLAGQGSVTWRRQVILPQRGRFTWGTLRTSSGYPFGLVERRSLLTAEESITVLPSLGWLHRGRFLCHMRELSVPSRDAHLRQKPRPSAGAQAEFHGLRSYRSSDSPRLIHWRTSARRGELMVREFEDEPSDNLVIIVDPTLPLPSSSPVPERDEAGGGDSLREQFEEMVSLVASICWEWCRQRDDRLVLATATSEPVVLEGLTGPTHARRILECLAVLECGSGAVDTAVLGRLQARRLPTALVVVIALGRSALSDPLRRALGRRVHCLDATRTDCFDFYKPPST